MEVGGRRWHTEQWFIFQVPTHMLSSTYLVGQTIYLSGGLSTYHWKILGGQKKPDLKNPETIREKLHQEIWVGTKAQNFDPSYGANLLFWSSWCAMRSRRGSENHVELEVVLNTCAAMDWG